MTSNTQQQTQEAGIPLHRRVLRWVLRGLAAAFLLVLVALSLLSAALGTHRGSQWVLSQATTLINIESTSFSYTHAEGTFLRGIDLYGLVYRTGENTVTVAQLHSRWNPMTLLEGEFHLESLRIAGLQVDWHSSAEPAPETPPMVLDDVLEPILPLPVAVRLSNARLDGADINFDDTNYVINSVGLNASLQGHTLALQQFTFDATPVRLSASLELELETPYPISGDISWRLDDSVLEGTEPPRGRLQVSGNLDRLQIEHSLAGLTDVQSSGEVQLGLARFLNARADAVDLRVDLQHTLGTQTLPGPGMENYTVQALTLRTQGTPEDLSLFAAARLDAALAEDFVLETDLNLRAALRGSALSIDELALRTATGLLAVTGNVDWTDGLSVNLDYELNEPLPDAYIPGLPDAMTIRDLSVNGEVAFSQGTGDDPEISLAFTGDNLQATINDYVLNGHGNFAFDGSNWNIDTLELQTGDNRLALTAQMLDDGGINLEASIDAPDLSVLYPELGGRLQADATVTGSLEAPVIDLDLTALNVAYADINIPALYVTGQNRGGMNEIELTAGEIDIPVGEGSERINEVLLRLRGQPDAHNLLLVIDSTLVDLRVNADGAVAEGGWQGRLLSSEIDSAYGRWQQTRASDLLLSAQEVSLENLCWNMVDTNLCLTGTLLEAEQVNASLTLDRYPLTALNLPRAEQNIANALQQDFHAGNTAREDIRLPFTLPDEMALEGLLSVQASVSGAISNPESLNIQARASSENGNFYVRSEPPLDVENSSDDAPLEPVITHFSWPELSLTATQDSGQWQLLSRLRFQQEDPESAAAVMRGSADANITMEQNRDLNGTVRIDFEDLAFVEALAPQLTQVTGELNGELTLQGNLDAPIIGGDVSLLQAGFTMPALGIEMGNIEVTLSSDNTDEFSLTAYAESGGGSLNISSEILRPFDEQRSLNLQIAGSDFVIANLPELEVSISPDLRATASQSGIDVNGRLLIPTVDARITTLPESAVDVSRDTVIVQNDPDVQVRNAAQVDRGPLSEIPISGEVRLILGNDVRVSGFGLSAQLQGQLDIDQRPGAAPLTYGELEVAQGSFEIYGRTLNIEQGKLLFMGSYDNPAIDIRAVRQVENMRVGVQMNGTIRNIRSNLFSSPSLPDGDILAVMITGRPIAEIGNEQDGNALVGAVTQLGINQGQGITNQIQSQLGLDTFSIDSRGDVNDSSLLLGKYITPRIFVRYAVGLFETENSLAIDYTISDRVKLEASSGQAQSVDLTYTVEQ